MRSGCPRPRCVRACSTPRPRLGFAGGRPSDTVGMPGPRSGAPNRSALRVASPSVTVPPAYTSGAAACTPGDVGDPAEVDRRERRRPDERARSTVLDEKHVDAEGIDGLLRLGAESVRQPGQHQRHGEDDGGGQDRDDETSFSPLHIAQRGEQHLSDVTEAARLRVGFAYVDRRPQRPAAKAPTRCCRRRADHRACGWRPVCWVRASTPLLPRRPSWRPH